MMKKLNYKILRASCLTASCIMFNASQSIAAVGDSFTVGNLEYEVLTEDGTTGTVVVKKCTYYSGSIIKFHIPAFVENQSHSYQVVSIGENSFSYCLISAVSIPDGVIKIEDGAFYRTKLESVSIPDSVTEIGHSSFAWCDNLAKVTLGKNVTSIGEYAFGRSSLTDILIPASVTFIGRVAFGNSFDLKNILVDPNNPSYSSNNGILFDKNKKVLIKCPNGKEVTNYTVPDSVNRIEEWAFSDCENLTEITIPDSVTSIGEGAFNYCTNLTNVTIGKSVLTIGNLAFRDCESLTEITIPDSVTSIGESTFGYCTNLTDVTIGRSVNTIGDRVFDSCESLISVYYRGNMPAVGNDIYVWTPKNLVSYYPERNTSWTSAIQGGQWQDRGTATWEPEPSPDASNLTYTFKNDILTLTYTGTLYQSSDAVNWTEVGSASNPYKVKVTNKKLFFCARSESGEPAKQNFTIPLPVKVTLDMVWCPPGTFIMGSPEDELGRRPDETQHSVTLSRGFWIGKYEVTQAQYKVVIGSNPSYFSGNNNPVESVSWYDAMEFCQELTAWEKTAGRLPEGYEYTLPTEVQWEYACRAGTTTAFNNETNILTEAQRGYDNYGNLLAGEPCPNLDEVGWYRYNSDIMTHPVGQKRPNNWGIYDMHGNVYEWCLDWYSGYEGGLRVIRGGSFGGSFIDLADCCRSAYRDGMDPSEGCVVNCGFRIALSPIQ